MRAVALTALRRRYPALPLAACRLFLRLAHCAASGRRRSGLERVIAVGFPTTIPDHEYVDDVKIPKYFVQSTHDDSDRETSFPAFYDSLPEPKHLDWIEAADHFFKDDLDDFEAAIEGSIASRSRDPTGNV